MKTPVAFMIFNRPDLTAQVFHEIANARPPKLFVIADGPRADQLGEADKCAAARAVVERVNWDCEVVKNYSATNLGCGVRVATGISWVFDQTEEAIILEDDCVPHPTFFRFCEELQDEISSNLVLEVGYLGNVSHHLTANDLSIDQVAPQLLGPGNAQLVRPFPQFSNVSIINPPVGNSNYQAGFVKVERRFSHGFSLLAHYTFSKFLDDAAAANEFGDPGSYMNAYNRRLDKGLSGSDIPHRGVVTLQYTVPGLAKSHLLDRVAGGWQLGLLSILESGQVFTVYDSVDQSNSFSAGTMRPNLTGDPNAASPTLARWLNTAAFQSAAPYTFGDSPRSVLRGPAWRNVDLTLSKKFKLTERIGTEFRGEFFNVINHPNFDTPGHTLGNAGFGTITSAEAARTVQVALRVMF